MHNGRAGGGRPPPPEGESCTHLCWRALAPVLCQSLCVKFPLLSSFYFSFPFTQHRAVNQKLFWLTFLPSAFPFPSFLSFSRYIHNNLKSAQSAASMIVEDTKTYSRTSMYKTNLRDLCCAVIPPISFLPPCLHISRRRFCFVFGCKQWCLLPQLLCEDWGARLLMIGVKTKSLIYVGAP